MLLLSASTKPRAVLFSTWQYASMPSQWASIIAANFRGSCGGSGGALLCRGRRQAEHTPEGPERSEVRRTETEDSAPVILGLPPDSPHEPLPEGLQPLPLQG